MTEKIKVNREVAEALDKLLNTNLKHDLILRDYAAYLDAGVENSKSRFHTFVDWGFSLLDFARLLDRGYEIEKTPQEHLKERIDHNKKRFKDQSANDNPWSYRYHDGFIDGALETLKILNIQVEGVNVG